MGGFRNNVGLSIDILSVSWACLQNYKVVITASGLPSFPLLYRHGEQSFPNFL